MMSLIAIAALSLLQYSDLLLLAPFLTLSCFSALSRVDVSRDFVNLGEIFIEIFFVVHVSRFE